MRSFFALVNFCLSLNANIFSVSDTMSSSEIMLMVFSASLRMYLSKPKDVCNNFIFDVIILSFIIKKSNRESIFNMSRSSVTYVLPFNMAYKPKSAKRKIACVKAFYRYMEIEDIIDFNPFHKIILKYKEPLKLPRTIPLNCIKDMLTFAYKQYSTATSKYQKEVTLRNIVVLELLFSTGMRVSEVSHLKLSAVNLNDNTVRIFGKGSKERIMCISNNLSKTISSYLKICSRKTDYLLINKLGNRLSEQSIRYIVNDYANAVGAPLHITPHMFRHTFATELHNENVDIRYIQQFLGHSSIATTQIYTHISTSKTREILESKHPRNKMNLNLI